MSDTDKSKAKGAKYEDDVDVDKGQVRDDAHRDEVEAEDKPAFVPDPLYVYGHANLRDMGEVPFVPQSPIFEQARAAAADPEADLTGDSPNVANVAMTANEPITVIDPDQPLRDERPIVIRDGEVERPTEADPDDIAKDEDGNKAQPEVTREAMAKVSETPDSSKSDSKSESEPEPAKSAPVKTSDKPSPSTKPTQPADKPVAG